jgi:steroid delta-isomerase-like uncharacterized protein
MRKVSFGLAVGFVLVACGGGESEPPKTPATPAPTMTPAPTTTASAEPPKEEPKKASFAEMQAKTMTGFMEAINAHDAKKLSTMYTDSATVKVAGAPDVTGREAIAASWQKLFDAFSNYKVGASRVFKKDDVAIVEWSFNGTHSGDLWGMKATEKPVGAQGVDVAWFDKDTGLIKEHHVYYDGATILSQIGVSKQKARPIPTVPSSMPTPIESKGTPEESKNVDVYKATMAAMEAKKEADFLAGIADNAEYDDMTMPQTMKGKAEAKKFFKEMTTAFPDAKGQLLNAWGFGDYIVAEMQMTGTNKGPFMGMPATKKTINVKGLDVQQFKDGKMVRGWSYSNGAEFAQQMGLMPTPKPAGDKGATPAKPGDKPADKGATPAKPATPATPSDKGATPAKPADKATPATPAKPADKK